MDDRRQFLLANNFPKKFYFFNSSPFERMLFTMESIINKVALTK